MAPDQKPGESGRDYLKRMGAEFRANMAAWCAREGIDPAGSPGMSLDEMQAELDKLRARLAPGMPHAPAVDAPDGFAADSGSTGVTNPHGRSEAIERGRQIAMTAMDLAEARWRHEHGQPHRRDHCETCAREAVADAARPGHYREAADSLDKLAAARLDTAPDAIAYARAEGIKIAADRLRSAAKGMEDGE